MISKEQRKHPRVKIISEKVIIIPHSPMEAFEVDLDNISSGGAYLKTAKLAPKQHILVKLQLPGDLGALQLEAVVLRKKWAKTKKSKEDLGVAIKFLDLSSNIQKILDAFLIYLRNKQIITVSRRIIDEFFPPAGPKGIPPHPPLH